jgi:hypothetical protein
MIGKVITLNKSGAARGGFCEAVWAIHRDTDAHHVHLIINRVHPVRGIVVGPPRFDYFVIDRAHA